MVLFIISSYIILYSLEEELLVKGKCIFNFEVMQFLLFPQKTVPVYTLTSTAVCQHSCLNSCYFQTFYVFDIWWMWNPTVKIVAHNSIVWISYHLFKSRFWCRACSFHFFCFIIKSVLVQFLGINSKSGNAGLNVLHI